MSITYYAFVAFHSTNNSKKIVFFKAIPYALP